MSKKPERTLVALGSFREDNARRLQDVGVSLGVDTQFITRCDDLPDFDEQTLAAFVLKMDAQGAAQAAARIRANELLVGVPLFGVARERNDVAFGELFSWGGDDLIGLESPQPIVRRLRPLVREPAARRVSKSQEMRAARGVAVVVSADAAWRTVMGRVLHTKGGFAVRFVANPNDLVKECAAAGVVLVVGVDDLPPRGAADAIAKTRAAGSNAAWIVVAPPKRLRAAHAATLGAGMARVSIADSFAPPENALFLANELITPRGVDKRASARLLYGETVAFRAAGRDEDETGFSYNVSAAGVYVRTLAPLDAGQEVWLDLWPPRSERRVRLAGTVAWTRPFEPSEHATVPPGFGVKITDGLAGDLQRWREGYDLLAENLFGTLAQPTAP